MEQEEKKIKISDLKNKYVFRTTGEEVEIVSFYKEKEGERSINDWVSYIDAHGCEHYREHYNIDFDLKQTDKLDEYLNKLLDFPKPEPLKPLELPKMPTHEECLREQAAIAAMQGVMKFFGSIDYDKETIAEMAVEQSDALIKELKCSSADEVAGDRNKEWAMSVLDFKITNCALSIRTMNLLKSAGIDTIGELLGFSKYDLLKNVNFGKKSVGEIEDFLAGIGLKLKGE